MDRSRREKKPKRGRLSRSADFARVYRNGRSRANRYLVVYTFPREEASDEVPRLGISVSRKVGDATERNRIKRLLREAFWAEMEEGDVHDCDYVIVARPDVKAFAEDTGLQGVRAQLRELLGKKDD